MRPLWALNLSLRYDHVTGQQVLCFNSVHLNTAWMSNIKDVPMVIVLHYHFSWYRARLSDCDKISSLPVFHVDEKFTHQVIYFNIKLSILYVWVKIYTSSLLHCYEMPIFNLKYIFVHQSERRYCNVSVATIFMPIFINQERLVSSFLLVCLMRMHWRENFGSVLLIFQRMFSPQFQIFLGTRHHRFEPVIFVSCSLSSLLWQ